MAALGISLDFAFRILQHFKPRVSWPTFENVVLGNDGQAILRPGWVIDRIMKSLRLRDKRSDRRAQFIFGQGLRAEQGRPAQKCIRLYAMQHHSARFQQTGQLRKPGPMVSLGEMSEDAVRINKVESVVRKIYRRSGMVDQENTLRKLSPAGGGGCGEHIATMDLGVRSEFEHVSDQAAKAAAKFQDT